MEQLFGVCDDHSLERRTSIVCGTTWPNTCLRHGLALAGEAVWILQNLPGLGWWPLSRTLGWCISPVLLDTGLRNRSLTLQYSWLLLCLLGRLRVYRLCW